MSRSLAMLFLIILSLIADYVTKKLLLSGLRHMIARTETAWDDLLLEHRVFDRLSHLAPAIILILFTPMALEGYEQLIFFITNVLYTYMVIIGMMTIDGLLNGSMAIYRTFNISKEIPIKAFVQVLKIVLYFLGTVFIVSIILNKTPLYLLSGLGALTAIFMLIFKDAILGFVAGIQLTANKMVSPGDWIEMPKYGADGDVIEVALTTVKIQNFDKTVTTIPTYALISESFKNWRSMSESGGRRIKRAIHIDLSSIQFCTEEMLERFTKIQYISNYIDSKKRELPEHNKRHQVDDASQVNGRRMTNIGTLRAYTLAYLKNHPQIHPEMTLLVRQLAPTEHGLPIEIYVFCKDTVWGNYEAIQADIFDHLLSVIPEFDLKVFQGPSGSNLKELTTKITGRGLLTEDREIR
ncbi:MAG: mechanosensitive ion channel family protein [Nitrospiria bacterium]